MRGKYRKLKEVCFFSLLFSFFFQIAQMYRRLYGKFVWREKIKRRRCRPPRVHDFSINPRFLSFFPGRDIRCNISPRGGSLPGLSRARGGTAKTNGEAAKPGGGKAMQHRLRAMSHEILHSVASLTRDRER